MLSRDEIDKLWIPFIVFENTENSEATVGEDETEVTVTREGSYTESSVDVNEEINIFEGSQNRVTFQQLYSKEFKCEYQLQLYPFDTQVGSQRQIRGKSTSPLLDLYSQPGAAAAGEELCAPRTSGHRDGGGHHSQPVHHLQLGAGVPEHK